MCLEETSRASQFAGKRLWDLTLPAMRRVYALINVSGARLASLVATAPSILGLHLRDNPGNHRARHERGSGVMLAPAERQRLACLPVRVTPICDRIAPVFRSDTIPRAIVAMAASSSLSLSVR